MGKPRPLDKRKQYLKPGHYLVIDSLYTGNTHEEIESLGLFEDNVYQLQNTQMQMRVRIVDELERILKESFQLENGLRPTCRYIFKLWCRSAP